MKYDLKTIKGIGEKTEKLFAKVGIFNTEDLLSYYPRDYDIYEIPVAIKNVKADTKAAVAGTVIQAPEVKKVRNLTILSIKIRDDSGFLYLTWFNMPFLRNTLKRGASFIFRGRVSYKNNRMVMEQPEMFTKAAYHQVLHHMQPIYSLTAGLTNKTITRAVQEVFKSNSLSYEYLPEAFRKYYELAEYNYALSNIHFPKNVEDMKKARKRLVFDEFFLFILALARFKGETQEIKNSYPLKEVWKTEEIIERLPYQLTNAQQQVWLEIERDLKGHTLMTRLVQGDVGSGKTIIAFLAMVMVAENGYQSSLMVPTEVLAAQHYEALRELLTEAEWETYRPLLLTGSNTAKEKRERYDAIASGKSKLILGTHALIQEKVQYHNLALVITDEQHRFGVAQREALGSKGNYPNILVMSATPIPRTLAIILYGDLDISIIDELPAQRLPIKNCVVDQSYRPTAYRFLQKEVEAGRQVYVICPMVEESESLEAENVVDYSQSLQHQLPDDINVGMLHGQMKPKDKNDIMERFVRNEIQVLVSTTVVEVGVNVPNATVMMVENAERFGLAQLHQLRGRVGRGAHQSYCIFMQSSQNETTSKRLEILNKSNDGFFIAGEDLKLRGPGDLMGIRQSGQMEFIIADIYQDADILKLASEAASTVLTDDVHLQKEEHTLLNKKLKAYMKHQVERMGL